MTLCNEWRSDFLSFFVSGQSNDEEFSKQLAALCDYYVNDAFGTAHRAHASTEGITKFVERKVGRCRELDTCRTKSLCCPS